MQISYEPTKYHLYAFNYQFSLELLEFCRWIKEKLGWKIFSFTEKKWRFTDMQVVDMIKNRFPDVGLDDIVKQEYDKYRLGQAQNQLIEQKAQQLKAQATSSLVIKGLKGELYPYQKIGVEFLINNNGKAILADLMGLGKSIQSLAYIVHQKINKTLVICPASVKYSWENEVLKWTRLKPYVINSKSELTIPIFREHDVFIINYDIVKKFFNFLQSVKIEASIVDEFHFIKSNSAQRTKLVKNLVRHMPSIILLSGTPMLSRPVELFNGLNLMDPYVWNNWMAYTKKYCGGWQSPWGWDVRGASNVEELKQRISKYFLRRTKEDVLPELPPKRFIDVPVELDSDIKSKYELAMDSFIEYLRKVKSKKEQDIQRTLQAEKLVRLGELRQLTTQGKIKPAEELIKNILDSDQKLIVFSCYNEPLEYLENKFKKEAVLITGKTPELLRKSYINQFQENPKIKLFLGGIKSAGVGITLTAASNVMFIDYSWVPADHSQAADRCHRIGQTAESINIYQLYTKGTIDEKMKDILLKKQAIFDKLINESDLAKPTKINLIDNLIDDIKKENKL